MDNVTWITFHSAYDFGYLLAQVNILFISYFWSVYILFYLQLTAQKLPDSETEFLDSLKIFFPNLYDIKYLMLSTDNLMGGLQSGEYWLLIGQ